MASTVGWPLGHPTVTQGSNWLTPFVCNKKCRNQGWSGHRVASRRSPPGVTWGRMGLNGVKPGGGGVGITVIRRSQTDHPINRSPDHVDALLRPCSLPVTPLFVPYSELSLSRKRRLRIKGLSACRDQDAGIFPVIFPVSRKREEIAVIG